MIVCRNDLCKKENVDFIIAQIRKVSFNEVIDSDEDFELLIAVKKMVVIPYV